MDEKPVSASTPVSAPALNLSYLLPADVALPPPTTRDFRSNEKVRRFAEFHQEARLVKCDFRSPVALKAWADFSILVFEGCVFHEHVEGSKVRFAGAVYFLGCKFLKSITLAEAEFKRGLTVAFCDVAMQIPPMTNENPGSDQGTQQPVKEPVLAGYDDAPHRERSAWWPGLRVTGMLRLDRSRFDGSVNLAEARIDGPLFLRGVNVGYGNRGNCNSRGRLHLRQIHVASDLSLSPHVPDRKFKQAVPSKIKGSVVLAGAKIDGRLDLRGAIVRGRLHLPHAHVRDRLDAEVWRSHADTREENLLPTKIGQRRGVAVRMADARIEHGVWFDGAQLRGQLNAKNAHVGGDFYFRKPRNYLKSDQPSRARTAKIHFIVGGDEANETKNISEALKLEGAHIGGSLDFTAAEIEGSLRLENMHVVGDLHLRGTKVTERAATVARRPDSGHIKLHATQVGRLLDLRRTRVQGNLEAQLMRVGGDLKFRMRFPEGKGEPTARGADFSETTVEGVVECNAAGTKGKLNFEGMKAEGMELAVSKDARLCVPDEINLCRARFGWLRVKGTFCPFELRPFMDMRGLRFEELDVSELDGSPVLDRSKDNIGRLGRFRWRLYHLELPTKTEMACGGLVSVAVPLFLWGQGEQSGAVWFTLLGFCTGLMRALFVTSVADRPRGERLIIAILLLALLGVWASDASIYAYIAFIIGAGMLTGRILADMREVRLTLAPYPSREPLFLAQMVRMDASVYARVENWLKNHGRHREADRVYVYRRMRELEGGVLAWSWNALRWWRRAALNENERKRVWCALRSDGRAAIHHPHYAELVCLRAGEELDSEAWRELGRRIMRFFQRTTEWLLFLLVGDGGRVAPAVILWLATLALSATCIFREPESVERPAVFAAERDPRTEADINAETKQRLHGEPSFYWWENMGDAGREHEWGIRDGFWMALNAQLPLANFAAREKWRASSKPVKFLREVSSVMKRAPVIGPVASTVASRCSAPRYDTVYGVFQIWGWLTVPIILASFTGLLKRNPIEVEKESRRD